MIDYYLITKPGIILGNLLTFAAGFILGTYGHFNLAVFFAALSGIGLVIASACIFNNYIDRFRDQKMERTKKRALAAGTISNQTALIYGSILALLGSAILLLFTNMLTLIVTASGFFIYVFLYSLLKGKTVLGTAIGSIAGAVPPVAGYTAASGTLDTAAWLLFALLVLWQMPHFYSIALLYLEDYKRAGIPVLPAKKGVFRTKVHMALYISLLLPTALLLSYWGYTGLIFLGSLIFFGTAWFTLCLYGFSIEDTRAWSRQMFRLSLILICALCLSIPLDRIFP
jgi:protoheme IX farnesyltransferase